jgi:hypothetical protein
VPCVDAATGATEARVGWAGGGVDGKEDGDKFGWSAMKRRAAVACLARGERRGSIRARDESMLARVGLEGCRDRRPGESVNVRVGNKS